MNPKAKREITEVHRRHLSKAHKGQKAWNKGLKIAKRVTYECKLCKKKFEGYFSTKRVFCSSHCQAKFREGKKITKEIRDKISKALTGKKRGSPSLEHRIKLSRALKGEKSYLWRGGKSFEPYTTDWTRTLRRSIRERDKYICQLCGELQGDRVFDVHHIDYNKENCDPKNLITLCQNCHRKTNFNRKYWTIYFYEIK